MLIRECCDVFLVFRRGGLSLTDAVHGSVLLTIIVNLLDRDCCLRGNIVWEVVGSLLNLVLVRLLFKTSLPLIVLNQCFRVTNNVPRTVWIAFVEGIVYVCREVCRQGRSS